MQLRRHPEIIGLVSALVFVYIASHAVQANWTFFTMYKFGWNEQLVGISLGVSGLMAALVQGYLIRLVQPRLGNERTIIYGLSLYAVGLLLFAFASQSWMMFAFLVPYGLGGIAGPALQAVISTQVPRGDRGSAIDDQHLLLFYARCCTLSVSGRTVLSGIFADERQRADGVQALPAQKENKVNETASVNLL